MQVATGLANRPDAEQAARAAVEQAMARAGLNTAGAVILFLSSDHTVDPGPAIRAAARAARCTQIFGCTAAGVLTEEDWYLDAPAAAALVLPPDHGSLAPAGAGTDSPCLTLAAPNAVSIGWLHGPQPRFGAVAGDATGQGPYLVWSGGRPMRGHVEARFAGLRTAVGVSPGLLPLGPARSVTAVQAGDLVSIDDEPAALALERAIQSVAGQLPPRPAYQVEIVVCEGDDDPETSLASGRYRLAPLVNADAGSGHVALANGPGVGERVFFALRSARRAVAEIHQLGCRLTDTLRAVPQFGMMFPCMGRGPYFHAGLDEEQRQFVASFPGVPLIGFYGNGGFAPGPGRNRLLHYATVLALMTTED